MFFDLADLESIWGPFRLFRYLSFRCALAATISFWFGILSAPAIIAWLKKINFKQTQRDEKEVGELAKINKGKEGTPIMGGVIIYASVMISSLLLAKFNALVCSALFVYTALTALGFADDFLKVKYGNSKGIPGKAKLLIQALVTGVMLTILMLSKDYSAIVQEIWVPFLKEPIVEAGTLPIFAIWIFLFFVVAGSSNAINLTDGLDGLAIGCTVPVALTYAVFSYLAGNIITCEYLFLQYINGSGELTVICFALLGASLAFLWYNAPKADVWMGDTGSLALGGLIGSIAFMVQQPFTLIIVGGIFVMETMSVMIQVTSFKLTGKRVFKMTPIHHSFQIKGWIESKLVIRFWILSLIFALAGLATLKLR